MKMLALTALAVNLLLATRARVRGRQRCAMYRHLFGVETYILVQLAALLLFCTLSVFLFRRASIRLWHAAALGVLYVVCNFLIAKVLYDYVKAGGRHTLFD